MKNIIDQIKNSCDNIYDVYFLLYKECIFEEENPSMKLKEIITEMQKQEFVHTKNSLYIDVNYIEEIQDKYYELLKMCVDTLINENVEENEFYKKLYETVFTTGIFTQEEKAQAVYLYLLSEQIPGLPYFQVFNLLKMSDQEYHDTIQRIKPKLERVFDVLNRKFKSRTEEASQIYEIMSEIQSREEKIVFLSVYTNIIHKNAMSLVREDE